LLYWYGVPACAFSTYAFSALKLVACRGLLIPNMSVKRVRPASFLCSFFSTVSWHQQGYALQLEKIHWLPQQIPDDSPWIDA